MSDFLNGYQFWAECAYLDKKEFIFYSPLFTAQSWEEVETKAKELILAEWAKISPYPAPKIKRIRNGCLVLISASGKATKWTEYDEKVDGPVIGSTLIEVDDMENLLNKPE